jgi:hypothetical protein
VSATGTTVTPLAVRVIAAPTPTGTARHGRTRGASRASRTGCACRACRTSSATHNHP